MKLNARDVPQRLKQEGPPPVLLLYGQEQGLAARQAALVRRAVLSVEDEDMDAESHHGADLDVGRFLSGCNAFPFLAARRFVLLKDADQLAPPAREALLRYLKSPSKSSVLVVLAGPLEAKSPLRKAFEFHKLAWCVPCYPLEGRELVGWIRTTLREAGFSADDDAVLLLAERLEGDARNAESEMEKLYLFLGDRRRIALEDVYESVGGSGSQNGFTLAAAVFAGRVGPALTILDGLLESGDEPLALLGLLTQRLRRLIQGAAMLDKGDNPDAVATALQVFWKEKAEFFTQVRVLSSRRLANALLRCQEADRSLKSGGEPRRVMERLVMGLSRLLSADPASGGVSARNPPAPRQSPWP
ncbi:MAG: DNA polymerase III subunit delta [Magnetococcales bacterium]|nr:DNA polymerase III subunit delta [Magnetococcales bacterium]